MFTYPIGHLNEKYKKDYEFEINTMSFSDALMISDKYGLQMFVDVSFDGLSMVYDPKKQEIIAVKII